MSIHDPEYAPLCRVTVLLQNALGAEVAAIHVARLRAMIFANPNLAERILDAEERVWERVAAARSAEFQALADNPAH